MLKPKHQLDTKLKEVNAIIMDDKDLGYKNEGNMKKTRSMYFTIKNAHMAIKRNAVDFQ